MKVFLSYPSSQRELALRLKLALEAEGHELFFDRDDLAPGEAFHQAIREWLQSADVFVFLVAPASVAPGSYARAELSLAEARWPSPHRHVLPVVVAPTPRGDIPPYLLAVTLLEPQGDVVAETVARVAAMRPEVTPCWKRPRVLAGVALGVAMATSLGVWQVKHQRERAAQLAAQMQLAEEARAALKQCLAGAANEGLKQLDAIAARPDAPPAVAVAQQDCAMAALRTFIRFPPAGLAAAAPAFRAPLQAALQKPPPEPQRAADLRAHLGWADAMAWREQRDPALDPEGAWREALAVDGANPYAHAMRGWWRLARPPYTDEAVSQALDALKAAETSARFAQDAELRDFVRRVQLQGLLQRAERTGPLLQLLDRLRRGNEALRPDEVDRVWLYVYASASSAEQGQRVLAALPPEDNLATFLWAVPRPGPQDLSLRSWRYAHALLLRAAGRQAEAQAELVALRDAFLAERASGSLPDAVDRLLAAR